MFFKLLSLTLVFWLFMAAWSLFISYVLAPALFKLIYKEDFTKKSSKYYAIRMCFFPFIQIYEFVLKNIIWWKVRLFGSEEYFKAKLRIYDSVKAQV